jgi:hypothetical protein
MVTQVGPVILTCLIHDGECDIGVCLPPEPTQTTRTYQRHSKDTLSTAAAAAAAAAAAVSSRL